MTTYYLSKYALSNKGVIEPIEARDSATEGYVAHGPFGLYKVGRDAHETPEAAIAAAESARLKKIASLKKQIAALEQMKFRVEG